MVLVPKGFRFAAQAAGFRSAGRNDLGLVVSDALAVAAGVFTKNRFQAAPVLVGREMLENRATARAVLINAGQANACTGDEGVRRCRDVLRLAGAILDLPAQDILPASTGVIGPQLPMDRFEAAVPELPKVLGKTTPIQFAQAIMTTDAYPKIAWREAKLSAGAVRVLGVAKGAGMICPDMATLLGVVLTDASLDPAPWKALLAKAVDESFNKISVDGDTSTNDTIYGLANGASGVAATSAEDAKALLDAVTEVCRELAYLVVQDAEGGTRVMHIVVSGAKSDADAELAARTVGHSPLVKTAVYGRDPNWGRIVAALGRSGADFDPNQVEVSMSGIRLFAHGRPEDVDFDPLLAPRLTRQEVPIHISLGGGPGRYEFLAADLTHGYIDVNASYRS